MNWIIRRFKEPSSWRGLIVIAGIFGVSMSPEMQEQVIAIGVAALSLVEIIRSEKSNGTAGTATTAAIDSGAGQPTEQRVITPELTEEQRQALNQP